MDLAFALVDVVVVVAAYVVGLGLRMLDPLVGNPQAFWLDLSVALPVIVAIHIVANALAGAYGHVWEFASTTEAARLGVANASASAVILALSVALRGPTSHVVPIMTLVLGGVLSLLMMGLVRFRSRLFSFRKQAGGQRVIVVGSSLEAVNFARQANEIEGGGRVIGFVNGVHGGPSRRRLLAELPILGSVMDIANVVAAEKADQVVVVGTDPEVVRDVVDRCLEIDVRLRIFPAAEDIMRDRTAPVDVRDIRVEDLLVRDPVKSDMARVNEVIQGKVVLVTGAGGSIGSEIVRQILKYEPASVWALDRDETLLHEAQISWPGTARLVLSDVRDATSVLRAFERVRPDVVFHAAALKHVPVLEDFPEEAVLTNVIGTRNVIEAGSRTAVERFVLISTDKAVDPRSIMGATKRVAELLVKAGESRRDDCIYTAVRFGNVLGSRGSVIPTFVSQIRSGGPVTVTDPAMTRYFMTVGEAVQLVLQAAALAQGSEVYLLDMGEPVRIDDLARRLIRLAGLRPGVDIEIEYTGIRPGEKLEESLADGPLNTTENNQIFEVPLSPPDPAVLAAAVSDLEETAMTGDSQELVTLLGSLVEGRLWDDRTPDATAPTTKVSWS